MTTLNPSIIELMLAELREREHAYNTAAQCLMRASDKLLAAREEENPVHRQHLIVRAEHEAMAAIEILGRAGSMLHSNAEDER
jgi:hypothetical protein